MSLPTGAGKSLCYQLPALYIPKLTVVFSPTVALIEDQIRSLPVGLAARSHQSQRDERKLLPFTIDSPRLFYVCPEWLDNRRHADFLAILCNEGHVARFVIDEAHTALSTFRSAYSSVFRLRTQYPDIPFTLISASTTQEQLLRLTESLDMTGTCLRITNSSNRPNIHYSVIHVPRNEAHFRVRTIAQYMEEHPDESGLIFARTRNQAMRVARLLQEEGLSVDFYHSGVQEKLNQVLQYFHSGTLQAIVCTSAFAEGIDKNGVRFVFHYSIPPTLEAYYQETGRAGRDGLPSKCILFYNFSDIARVASVVAEEVTLASGDKTRELSHEQRESIQQVVNLCLDVRSCRRQHIVAPFADRKPTQFSGPQMKIYSTQAHTLSKNGNCEACDVCDMRENCVTPEEISSELHIIEEQLQRDYSVPKHELVRRVAKALRNESRARVLVEYMAATGVLALDFECQLSKWMQLRPMIGLRTVKLDRVLHWMYPKPPVPRPRRHRPPGLTTQPLMDEDAKSIEDDDYDESEDVLNMLQEPSQDGADMSMDADDEGQFSKPYSQDSIPDPPSKSAQRLPRFREEYEPGNTTDTDVEDQVEEVFKQLKQFARRTSDLRTVSDQGLRSIVDEWQRRRKLGLVLFDAEEFSKCVKTVREKEATVRGKKRVKIEFTQEVVNTLDYYSERIVRDIFDALSDDLFV